MEVDSVKPEDYVSPEAPFDAEIELMAGELDDEELKKLITLWQRKNLALLLIGEELIRIMENKLITIADREMEIERLDKKYVPLVLETDVLKSILFALLQMKYPRNLEATAGGYTDITVKKGWVVAWCLPEQKYLTVLVPRK